MDVFVRGKRAKMVPIQTCAMCLFTIWYLVYFLYITLPLLVLTTIWNNTFAYAMKYYSSPISSQSLPIGFEINKYWLLSLLQKIQVISLKLYSFLELICEVISFVFEVSKILNYFLWWFFF